MKVFTRSLTLSDTEDFCDLGHLVQLGLSGFGCELSRILFTELLLKHRYDTSEIHISTNVSNNTERQTETNLSFSLT